MYVVSEFDTHLESRQIRFVNVSHLSQLKSDILSHFFPWHREKISIKCAFFFFFLAEPHEQQISLSPNSIIVGTLRDYYFEDMVFGIVKHQQ